MATKFLELLDRLEELEKAATKGPWIADKEGCLIDSSNNHIAGVHDREFRTRPNANFVAALRNAAPGLIAVARAALALQQQIVITDYQCEGGPLYLNKRYCELRDAIANVEVRP